MGLQHVAIVVVSLVCAFWGSSALGQRAAPAGDFDIVGASPDVAVGVHLGYDESKTFRVFVKNVGTNKSGPASVRWSPSLKSGVALAASVVVFPALDPQQMISVELPFSLATTMGASHRAQPTGASDVDLIATIDNGTVLTKATAPKARTWTLSVDAPAPDLEIVAASPDPIALLHVQQAITVKPTVPAPPPPPPMRIAYAESKVFSITVRNDGRVRSTATLVSWSTSVFLNQRNTEGRQYPLTLPALDPGQTLTFDFTFNLKDIITWLNFAPPTTASDVTLTVGLHDAKQSKDPGVTNAATWKFKVDAPTSRANLGIVDTSPDPALDFKMKTGVAKKFSVTIKNNGNLKSSTLQMAWGAYAGKGGTGVFSFASDVANVPALNPGESFTASFTQSFTAAILKDASVDSCSVSVSFVGTGQSRAGSKTEQGWKSAVTH